MGGVTLFGTNGICDYSHVIVTKLPYQHFAADGTYLIVQTVSLSTGLVAKSFDLAVDVGIIATRAGVGGVTLFGTSGICDYSHVIVAERTFATPEFHSLLANRAEFGIHTVTFAGGGNVLGPIGKLMYATRGHDARRSATACRGLLSDLNTAAISTLIVVNVIALIAK